MIVLFRIDYRLLHYQTSSVWPNKVGANEILIADDDLVKDQMQLGLIKMMAPGGLKTKVATIEKAIKYLNSEESKDRKIQILVPTAMDAYRICKEVPDAKNVCAGLMKGTKDKVMVSKTLAFAPEDFEAFEGLVNLGVNVESYAVPEDTPIPITKYLSMKN